MANRTHWTALRLQHFGVLMLLHGAASIASAQWAWRDENGTTVYSDQPPPATVKAANVLRQPEPPPANPPDSGSAEAQASSNPAAPPPPQNAAAPAAPRPPTIAEQEMAFRKRMKERAEAERQLAEAQAEATRKAADCERARSYLKSLDDGVRLIRTNPDGSQELMDEAQRAAEVQRTREAIDSRCN